MIPLSSSFSFTFVGLRQLIECMSRRYRTSISQHLNLSSSLIDPRNIFCSHPELVTTTNKRMMLAGFVETIKLFFLQSKKKRKLLPRSVTSFNTKLFFPQLASSWLSLVLRRASLFYSVRGSNPNSRPTLRPGIETLGERKVITENPERLPHRESLPFTNEVMNSGVLHSKWFRKKGLAL